MKEHIIYLMSVTTTSQMEAELDDMKARTLWDIMTTLPTSAFATQAAAQREGKMEAERTLRDEYCSTNCDFDYLDEKLPAEDKRKADTFVWSVMSRLSFTGGKGDCEASVSWGGKGQVGGNSTLEINIKRIEVTE